MEIFKLSDFARYAVILGKRRVFNGLIELPSYWIANNAMFNNRWIIKTLSSCVWDEILKLKLNIAYIQVVAHFKIKWTARNFCLHIFLKCLGFFLWFIDITRAYIEEISRRVHLEKKRVNLVSIYSIIPVSSYINTPYLYTCR